VGNPGCYPTAVQLGFWPLLEAGLVDTDHLIADCKSGVSGAGRKAELNLIFPEASDNFSAYGVKGHRHLPEIVQGLNRASRTPVKLAFTPHLVPMIRGILATLYAPLRNPGADLQALYGERYVREPFVDVMPPGSMPDTRSVRASNMLRIAVHRPPGTDLAMVIVVEDNLVKGAAGQAVQNMNLMFGLSETTGLTALPVLP
jgi:N-acetyl-gamma-glutamyl-phosphate reductase